MNYRRMIGVLLAIQLLASLYLCVRSYIAGRLNLPGITDWLPPMAMMLWFAALLTLDGMLVNAISRHRGSRRVALSVIVAMTFFWPAFLCAAPWNGPTFEMGFKQWAVANIDVAAIQTWRQSQFPSPVADQPTPFWWRMDKGAEAPLGTHAEPVQWPAAIVKLKPDEVRVITFKEGTLLAWRGSLMTETRMVFVATSANRPPAELHQSLIIWHVVHDRLSVGIFDPR